MKVPGFQDIMLPLLKITQDSQEHTLDDAIEELSGIFSLDAAARTELLPSGRQYKFDNRVGWARTYLVKARLLDGTGRGKFKITERGQTTLSSPPVRIDIKYLDRYPEFLAFRKATRLQPIDDTIATINDQTLTPSEQIEQIYQDLRKALSQDLLEIIKKASPKFFERLVVDLLLAMGYGGSRKDAGQAIGQSKDSGVDGIIKEDKLGLDVVYVQAKRWDNTVGRPDVQAFAGSLEGKKARKGVFITTSQFSKEAHEFVGIIEKKIVLIDGEQLVQMMIDHNVGVAEEAMYVVKRVDSDYFNADAL
jgi:restriction system protein